MLDFECVCVCVCVCAYVADLVQGAPRLERFGQGSRLVKVPRPAENGVGRAGRGQGAPGLKRFASFAQHDSPGSVHAAGLPRSARRRVRL